MRSSCGGSRATAGGHCFEQIRYTISSTGINWFCLCVFFWKYFAHFLRFLCAFAWKISTLCLVRFTHSVKSGLECNKRRYTHIKTQSRLFWKYICKQPSTVWLQNDHLHFIDKSRPVWWLFFLFDKRSLSSKIY